MSSRAGRTRFFQSGLRGGLTELCTRLPFGIQVNDSRYLLRKGAPGENRSTQFHQAVLRLAHQYEVSPILQILFGMVRRIRTMSNHDRSRFPCGLRQLPGHIPHARQAHLGKKVEVVFVDSENLPVFSSRSISRKPLTGSCSMGSKTAAEKP